MKRWLALVVIAAMLAVPAASSTGWLQPRGDAAATGFQPEQGPQWPDVALRVQLNGSMKAEAAAPPLILEDQVLFLAREAGDDFDGTYQVYSLGLDDGNPTVVAGDLDIAARLSMATDGETLFVSDEGNVHAVPLGPDGSEWTWAGTVPSSGGIPQDVEMDSCWRMSLERDHLTVLCLAWDTADRTYRTAPGGSAYTHVMVARLDAETGEPLWVWDPTTVPPADHPDYKDTGFFPVGLAVSETRVVVQALETSFAFVRQSGVGGAGTGQARYWVWALDKNPESSTGSVDWRWASPTRNISQPSPPGPAGSELGQSLDSGGNPAVTEDSVYVKAEELYRLNLGPGDKRWEKQTGEADFEQGRGLFATGVALDDEDVYATSAQTVYGVSQAAPEDGWSTNLDFADGQRFQLDPIVTPEAMYISTRNTEGTEELYAFDTATGDELWAHTVENRVNAFSVVEGLIAYADVEFLEDGNVNTTFVILGRTEASPTVEIEPTTTYPDPGEQVEVNLSASEAGAQGPVTRYKAIWGDGTTSGWQGDPVLRHAYNEPQEQTARFVVANEANQTNSTNVTFHVGEEEPTEPNLVETAFQKENQEMTFGILGIAMALGGGIIGIARRRRKKSVLREELDALEQGYEDTKDQPSECEALLDNRKARARSLALDGKLEEQQVTIIEDRAEELRSELRVDALEDQFGFLPYSLVTKARQMVEDGTVTALERDAFLQATEEDDVLTGEQKALVRERVEQWFARDAGGG